MKKSKECDNMRKKNGKRKDFSSEQFIFEVKIPSIDIYIDVKSEMTGKILMESMEKTSLFNCANYLVHLYDKLDGTYASDPVKIQKMLFIALLYSFKHNNESFLNENVNIEYGECGIKIRQIYDEIRNFISDGDKIDSEIVSKDVYETISKYKKSRIYKFDETNVPDCIKSILNSVFMRFGSYSSTTLGELINELRANIDSGIFSGAIPIEFKVSDIPELMNKSKLKNSIWEYINTK